ncbi:MAG: CotH kinase family protein [Bacteroidales bacterium]
MTYQTKDGLRIRMLTMVAGIFLTSFFVSYGQIYMINEIAPLNDFYADEYGEYDDWIELYNNDVNTVWLDEVYLTDDFDEPLKYKIDGPYKMQPGSFLIIWLDGQTHQGQFHASFKLKSGGEQLAITQIIGDEMIWIDSLTFGPVLMNTTLGRISDGNPDFDLLTGITPGYSNNGALRYMEAPDIQPEGKILEGIQEITITAPDAVSPIYYTLDGTEPGKESNLYSGPFRIDSTLQINAKAFKTGFSGATSRASYILKSPGSIPVLSLELASDDLFDDEKGIYVQGSNGVTGYCIDYPANWNQDWEKPGRISMFEPDGRKAFSCNTGIQIGGGCSRGLNMKSFNLYLRDKYGYPSIPYQVFPGSEIREFHRLKIRNAGTDNGSMMLRDGINQLLFRDKIDMDLMNYRPAVIYLNSEFWGIYGIREFINEDYIYSHYGYKEDEYDLIKSPYSWMDIKVGNDSAYRELYRYIISNDLAEQTNYSHLEELMDINEYINYNIAQIYLANYDWPSINTYIWKPHKEGKWRWILFDTDGSTNFDLFYDTYPSYNSLMHATIPMFEQWPNSEESTLFLRKFLENERFKNEFAQRTCTYIELLFHPDRVNRITDSIVELIDPYVDQTLQKWGQNIPELGWGRAMGGSREKWEENIQLYKDFFMERPFYMQKYINEYCRFGGTYRLNLNTDRNSHGKVFVNSNRIELPLGFGADYFKNIPVKLFAVPDEGYAFYKWAEIDDPNAEIEYLSGQDATLTPLFIHPSEVRENHSSGITLYPNPTSGIIHIKQKSPQAGPVSIWVFNVTGQLVLNETFNDATAEEILEFNLSHLHDGPYTVKIQTEQTQIMKQFILIKK